MRPMLAPKSWPSWPLLQACVIAVQVSAGDGTITAPLERADCQTHSTTTAAKPPKARPTRHRIGSSARIRRTGDCRRPRPAPFPRDRTGATVAGTTVVTACGSGMTSAAAAGSSSPTPGSLGMVGDVGLGERRVVEPLQGGPRLDEARPQQEVVDLPEHGREVRRVLTGVALDGVLRAEELRALGQLAVLLRAQLGVLG